MTRPETVLSLGAGVQSSVLLMLAAAGDLPPVDAAVFADTGWEPAEVYAHLDRLEAEVARPAGIPIHRVSAGNIRNDALDPAHRFASMPLFTRGADGRAAMGRRQCTNEYKLKPIRRWLRANGAHRTHPITMWVGISVDEFHRAKDSDVKYVRHEFPLLDIGWTRSHCIDYLSASGWETTPKSACLGCPFHHDSQWRQIRDTDPAGWADAVDFDEQIRTSRPGREQYLHRDLIPLAEAPLTRLTKTERAGGVQLIFGDPDEFTCSPFGCRGDAP